MFMYEMDIYAFAGRQAYSTLFTTNFRHSYILAEKKLWFHLSQVMIR